ncbi:MAG: ATP-binding protein [Deltaproteobacteria bacterium]|nr:ATP-binding protein [Deltaproteobacteria bacterium]
MLAGNIVPSWTAPPRQPAVLDIKDFSRHVIILGQSGSGKSVLLKRLVEEAALQGVSSLVIDASGDLTMLGDPWPEKPEKFRPEDSERAERYFREVDVVILTPFHSEGNPYKPPKVPDLRKIHQQNDKAMMKAKLEEACVAVPRNLGINIKDTTANKAVMMNALRNMAAGGAEPGLGRLIQEIEYLLSDPEGHNLTNSSVKAAETLLETFKTAGLGDPDLYDNGSSDVRTLIDPEAARPRVTVLSLLGGSDVAKLSVAQSVLGSVFDALPAWQGSSASGTSGLIVIDEATLFAPSTGSAASKEIVKKFADRARKYGCGLILATQAPKAVDHNIMNNCSTKFVGKLSSPATVAAGEVILNTDMDLRLSSLGLGQFYALSPALNESHPGPLRVRTFMCFSRHVNPPPGEDKIAEMARRSAARLAATAS